MAVRLEGDDTFPAGVGDGVAGLAAAVQARALGQDLVGQREDFAAGKSGIALIL